MGDPGGAASAGPAADIVGAASVAGPAAHIAGPASVAGPTVGIVGGGQLARMLAEAASPLGVHVRVLAADSDEGAREVVPDVLAGEPDDPGALRRLASSVDVVTIDHENVDHATLADLEAEGVAVRPSVRTLAFSDKAHQRSAFAAAGLPVPDFVVVDPADPDAAERVHGFCSRHGGQVVAKASRGGYDGRGVWMLGTDDVDTFLEGYRGAPLVVEPRLPLAAELAVLVARRPSGEVATWPVLETVQVGGMCDEVVLPPPVDEEVERRAREVATRVATTCDAVGVLAVELFVVAGTGGAPAPVLVNEIAPRVHNSGHLTIEGSTTSQFEQHLRAILDWPLGPTEVTAPVVVMANVVAEGGVDPRDRQAEALAAVPEAHVHLYGKQVRPKRKVGHVTVTGSDRERVRARAGLAAAILAGAPTGRDGDGGDNGSGGGAVG